MNWTLYMQEAFGLFVFMVSACFFGAFLFAPHSPLVPFIPNPFFRNGLMGLAMGMTALFIFYSPLTARSGAQINPAVTLVFLRLRRISGYDAVFYAIAQVIGGTTAVYLMQGLMGSLLTAAPVNSVVTVPGNYGTFYAFVTEYSIAFITMTVMLFTSAAEQLKKYTRILVAALVCCWVILAGPVSGFGMNPARTFASALPAHTWTAFWIYLLAPLAGMFSAAELFLLAKKKKWYGRLKVVHRQYEMTNHKRYQQHENTFTAHNG